MNLIENLPNSIEELNFGLYFYLELNNLPNSIKIIRFNEESYYKKELTNLPKQLEILYLPKKYNIDLTNINSDCKIIIIKSIFKNIIITPFSKLIINSFIVIFTIRIIRF